MRYIIITKTRPAPTRGRYMINISPQCLNNPRNLTQDRETTVTTLNLPNYTMHRKPFPRGNTSHTRRKTPFPSLMPREPQLENTDTAEYLKYVEYLTEYNVHRINHTANHPQRTSRNVRDDMRLRANKKEQDYATPKSPNYTIYTTK